MTEPEAIKVFSTVLILGKCDLPTDEAKEALMMAVDALEEIQKYRALEEKLNGITVEHVVNAVIERIETDTNEGYEHGRILTNADADMWNEYKSLGTPEELENIVCGMTEQELYREGYNKAIDDFSEKIKENISESLIWGMIVNSHKDNSFNDTSDKIVDYVIDTVKETAEQLKGGGVNE